MDTQEAVQLPKWKCHKVVSGDRIVEIRDPVKSSTGEWPMVWRLDCGGLVNVTPDLIARGAPMVGDYYVVYEDGYKSWSPAKAFEDGYTRMKA